ncbi:MAG: hypothetical protein AAGD07_14215 [Planctomycetota bacterium]
MRFVFAETFDTAEYQHSLLWPGHVAMAARTDARSGTAVFSAWVLSDEVFGPDLQIGADDFRDVSPIIGRSTLGCRQVNAPRFEFLEDGIGGCVHEVGHLLGLPHRFGDVPDDNMMGQGFRRLAENFRLGRDQPGPVGFSEASSCLMATSRFFNRDISRTDDVLPSVSTEWRGQDLFVSFNDNHRVVFVGILGFTRQGQALTFWREIHHEQEPGFLMPAEALGKNTASMHVIVADSGGNHRRAKVASRSQTLSEFR